MSFVDGIDGWFRARDVSAVRVKRIDREQWFVVVDLVNGVSMCADGPFKDEQMAQNTAAQLVIKLIDEARFPTHALRREEPFEGLDGCMCDCHRSGSDRGPGGMRMHNVCCK